MTRKRKPPPGPQPLVCSRCGQRGDQPPGFRSLRYPEAVGFDDGGMTPVHSLQCRTCEHTFVVPIGMLEVRQP